MRRVIFLLSMFAALTGTPLRQAEAWNDLARSLAELDCQDANLEEVDGGVGDDSGDAVRAIDAHAPVLLAISEALPAVSNLSLPISSPLPILTEELPPLRLGACERLAWLQRFLI